MQKRKVFHLLNLLGPEDKDRFSLFLASPYFNSSHTLIAFWNLWQEKVLSPESAPESSEEEFVAGSPIKLTRIESLCWELMVRLREFLALQSFEKSPETELTMFARSILDRDHHLNAYPRFVPQLEKDLNELPESPDKHLAIFLHKSESSRAHLSARKSRTDWQTEFVELYDSLQKYTLIKELQWACGMANANLIFRQKEPDAVHEIFGKHLNHEHPENPNLLIRLYRLCLLLSRGERNAEVFGKIRDILERRRADLAEGIRIDVFNFVLNYCIRQINSGNDDFLHHTFELYRLLLKFGDLLQDGQITPQQFKNTVSLACRVGELDWAREFIAQYHLLLPQPNDGLALQYNHAVLRFHLAEYDAAIRDFREIVLQSADDIFYGLDARIYLWKSYFENLDELTADEVDEMFRLYDSFRLYVDRHEKISPQHQLQYRNFVRLFKRFMKCLEQEVDGKRKSALVKFRKKLAETDEVANKTWFMQKVDEALGPK